MLKIRLQRTGRKNDPSYRVVVTEHQRGPKSENHVDRVGFYNPKTKEKKLDEEKIKHWISKGAQPSGTVHNMLIKAGIIKGQTINVLPQKSPVVKEVEEKEEAPKETTEEETTEETTEEVVEEEKTEEAPKEEEKTEDAPVEEEKKEEDAPKEEEAPVEEEKKEE
ncbi:30S ribosomal protein S16 [Candidatus Kaiserbacteria bacterium]|nr:MAG: 30S ribosomal protein S16 [Candidatus Kaiserbacteria bacterium]